MQSRIAKRTTLQRLVISGCALAALSSVGCKTGMSVPGASMLGFKKQPSAETLAGQGPTTTFPVSPSNTFTPNAIASKSAGTGTTNTTVPQGAAAANGFATTNATTAPTSAPPSYAMSGWGNPTSGTQPTTAPGFAPGGTAYQMPGQASVPSYAPPTSFNQSGTVLAAGTTTPNPYSQPSTYMPPAGTFAQPGAGNFAGSPYGAAAASSNPYAVPAGQPSNTTPAMGQFDPQAARVAGGFAMPQGSTTTAGGTMNPMGTTSPAGTTAPATFRPGSTAGATSYPATPYTTPNGSMLR